jgi:hypothetical protein
MFKTLELTGIALDWAVAKCEGETLSQSSLAFQVKEHGCLQRPHLGNWKPADSWAQGGPIIDREFIEFGVSRSDPVQYAAKMYVNDKRVIAHGPTHLVAAMRCYVYSKIGNKIKLPNNLCRT